MAIGHGVTKPLAESVGRNSSCINQELDYRFLVSVNVYASMTDFNFNKLFAEKQKFVIDSTNACFFFHILISTVKPLI